MSTGVALALAITVMIGLPSLTFIKNPVVQTIGLWASLLIAIRVAFDFTPNPLKIAGLAAAVVLALQLLKHINDLKPTPETFTGEECGTACDLDDTQPEKRLDRRVDELLAEADQITKEMEGYLHVNTPDERA